MYGGILATRLNVMRHNPVPLCPALHRRFRVNNLLSLYIGNTSRYFIGIYVFLYIFLQYSDNFAIEKRASLVRYPLEILVLTYAGINRVMKEHPVLTD